ncbi:GTP 3',8-cyclase MoaA [Candidatus Aerophobetes bacterium Ae_b3a]|nr:MAG: GTP 3',8-cyclase MoaA [Candidatus Aerophobetes bacterium Ae_b3a]
MKANYLRLSVTDHCNLSCFYCRPFEAMRHLKREEFLSFEEISHLVRLAVDWGIRKVRITGGEPLLRNNIVELIEMLSGIEGIRDLPITTNGVKLEEFAPLLKKAGVSRVNVSLDSLNRKGFTRITGQDNLGQVLRGIKVAKKAGLEPIKINVVVLKGINEGEILDFINFALENNLIIRFIEYMPTNGLEQNDWYFSNFRVKEIIERKWGSLEPIPFFAGSVARYCKIDDTKAVLGFISPISQPFCHQCNRLRLTATGKLKPCLASNLEIDIRKPLGEKAGKHEIKILFDLAMKEKLKGRPEPPYQRNKYMFQIGG